MANVNGKIEKIFQNEKNFVLVVNGAKYSSFGKVPTGLKVGDDIKFVSKQNGEYLNIVKDSLMMNSTIEEVVEIVNKTKEYSGIQDNKRLDIFRGQCLNLANAMLLAKLGNISEDEYISKLYALAEKLVKKGQESKFIV